MSIEIDKSYMPLAGEDFTRNLIKAEVFTTRTEGDCLKLQRELNFLNTQGVFELREV